MYIKKKKKSERRGSLQEVNFDWFSKEAPALEQSYTLQDHMLFFGTIV